MSRILLEKPVVPQPVKKFPPFYLTRICITAFTRTRHLSLSLARSIHPISYTYVLILSSHVRHGLPSGLFPLRFSHQNVCARLPPYVLTCITHVLFLHMIIPTIFGEEYIYHESPSSTCYLVPLGLKYLPQHPVLSHPQPTFLAIYE